LEIFSVSQDSHLGGNRRGGTSVYIRCCYSTGVKRRLCGGIPRHLKPRFTLGLYYIET
jgi:hypothetical protein